MRFTWKKGVSPFSKKTHFDEFLLVIYFISTSIKHIYIYIQIANENIIDSNDKNNNLTHVAIQPHPKTKLYF